MASPFCCLQGHQLRLSQLQALLHPSHHQCKSVPAQGNHLHQAVQGLHHRSPHLHNSPAFAFLIRQAHHSLFHPHSLPSQGVKRPICRDMCGHSKRLQQHLQDSRERLHTARRCWGLSQVCRVAVKLHKTLSKHLQVMHDVLQKQLVAT